MDNLKKIPNRLIHEKSPYLLQHANNPVDWFSWSGEAFEKAAREDKPIFLSIGYSTCHWCHVMAHESFEDEAVAAALNKDFVSVKVDREERPDVDGVYMRACQALTGSGGWPTSIFADPEGRPFFAGTYFPKENFLGLLDTVAKAWRHNRAELIQSGGELAAFIGKNTRAGGLGDGAAASKKAVEAFRRQFDPVYGGFGGAPKFPSPHNLMFLLRTAPETAEKTLAQMYKGGIFDHVGGGFSRYSTDRRWLVPHFEKMLYDNALLAMAYLLAFEATEKPLYRRVAERIFEYLEREMKAPGGGFYSAQDADSPGGEGAYYLFTPEELEGVLGKEDGGRFCRRYGVTEKGNFEGGSIPNLLASPETDGETEALLPKVLAYRQKRTPPHRDEKQLTAWNALALAAYAMAGRILGDERYLDTARETARFLEGALAEGDALYAGVTDGKRGGRAFLDDYAFYIFALIQLHQAAREESHLARAAALAEKAWALFWDGEDGGFFFSGAENEKLIARPKESWDGAMPSGNSVMAYNLSRLALLSEDEKLAERAKKQQSFMDGEAAAQPMGHGFYLWSALPVKKVVCAPAGPAGLPGPRVRSDWAFLVAKGPGYPPVDGRTTYYVCEDGVCLPPVHEI